MTSLSQPRSPRLATGAFLLPRVFVLAAAAPGLVRLPLPVLEAVLEPRRCPPPADEATLERVAATVERVLRNARPWVRPGCLTRGITRYYFLRRAGLELRLCFGATLSPEGELSGHCWLERGGEPYLEEADPRTAFVVMHCVPAAAWPRGS